ncbi:hypothetical protein Tco_1441406, partial [Tanacetum coccineum]
IQPTDQNSDDEPSYESAFISKVQSSSINENDEQMFPTYTKIINSIIDDDQINSNIQFDSVKGNVVRFYKMMNELVRNQCIVTNHQVNVQFLLQLKPEWQSFVTIVKQNQDLKNVSYHKLYDILKQHQNEVNEIRAEILACTANPLTLVAQQQPVYHPQTNPTHHTQSSSTMSQADTRNRGTQVVQQTGIQCYNYREFGHVAREYKKPQKAQDLAYHKEKMLLCKQEEAGIQLSAEQDDLRDDTYDKPKDQELEAHYMYMAKIQEVIPDVADNSGPIFDAKPLQKVHNDDDNYNVFANERQHPEQPKSVNDTYLVEQGDTNIIPDSSDMSNNGEEADQDDDLAKERDLLASLIEQLKCEIDDSKNQNKLLKLSNKAFKEANKELGDVNKLLTKDLDKFQIELDRYQNVNFVKDVENDCAKAYSLLAAQKVNSEKSFNDYTQKIIKLNQKLSEMEKELIAHQKTISTISHEKEAQ